MAIRIRQVGGVTVAVCAVETDPLPDDLYLDDAAHYALAAKFMEDWKGETQTGGDPELVAVMKSQKMRDADIEIAKWHAAAKEFQLKRPSVMDFGWAEIKPFWEAMYGPYYHS